MSWNKSFVLITNPPSLSVEQLLSMVAAKEYRIDRSVYLGETVKYYFDEPDAIFVGEFNSCLVLIHNELTWLMLETSLGDRATRIINFFKNSDIVAISENGTCYSFGYALIRNQQRIRLKIGDDGEILEDVGAALDAEKELLADMRKGGQYQALVDENLYEGDSIEQAHQLAQFEVSWRVPRVLSERYLEQKFDWLSDNLTLTRCLPT